MKDKAPLALEDRSLSDNAKVDGNSTAKAPDTGPQADESGSKRGRKRFPTQADRRYLSFELSFGKVKSITNPFLSSSASARFINSWASCSQV